MTTTEAKHGYANPAYLPAHDCVRLGICYRCHKPCKVERLPAGSIVVPWCGCKTTKTKEAP